tara:strand:+ start:1564 stop:2484 length:921 start_codon:yes stop_codon:yes gene_type:complete
MRILITGSKGQLGTELMRQLNMNKGEKPLEIVTPSKNELNLLDLKNCEEYVKDLKPELLINLAAYTAVDKAENDINNARTINGLALKSFANAVKSYGGYIIQISSDYVFNGEQKFPYQTKDARDPLGIYGKTKAEGEYFLEEILYNTNQFTIVRTSWLVSPWGNNFVKTILKKLEENKENLYVISDQIGCLTTAKNLACLLRLLIEKKMNKEILPSHLHWSSDGKTSWYEIALKIKEISSHINLINSKVNIHPIKTTEYKTSCPRPKFSLLDSSITKEKIGIKSNFWWIDLEILLKEIITLKKTDE